MNIVLLSEIVLFLIGNTFIFYSILNILATNKAKVLLLSSVTLLIWHNLWAYLYLISNQHFEASLYITSLIVLLSISFTNCYMYSSIKRVYIYLTHFVTLIFILLLGFYTTDLYSFPINKSLDNILGSIIMLVYGGILFGIILFQKKDNRLNISSVAISKLNLFLAISGLICLPILFYTNLTLISSIAFYLWLSQEINPTFKKDSVFDLLLILYSMLVIFISIYEIQYTENQMFFFVLFSIAAIVSLLIKFSFNRKLRN